MKVKVSYTAQIKTIIGHDIDIVDIPEECMLHELLGKIDTMYPGINRLLFDSDGKVNFSLLVAKNNEQVLNKEKFQVDDGDEILLISPVSGG